MTPTEELHKVACVFAAAYHKWEAMRAAGASAAYSDGFEAQEDADIELRVAAIQFAGQTG